MQIESSLAHALSMGEEMSDAARLAPHDWAAFEHVRRLSDAHDHLIANELKPGFVFAGGRIPLINPVMTKNRIVEDRFASCQNTRQFCAVHERRKLA